MTTTDKPSIAELQRQEREGRPNAAPTPMRLALPALLEIAAAALALRKQEIAANTAGCTAAASPLDDPAWDQLGVENGKLRACLDAYNAALAKVRP